MKENHRNLIAPDRAPSFPFINRNKKDKNHRNLALLDRAGSHLFARAVQKNRFFVVKHLTKMDKHAYQFADDATGIHYRASNEAVQMG
ncbi:hypothetical protein SAMN05216315_13215 [Nitrosospira sp. Nsp18]|nr:hypothetical protein SAMN05216315_13215 [Nitrosospira sp. Nsp18]